jgi:hypothetical protein
MAVPAFMAAGASALPDGEIVLRGVSGYMVTAAAARFVTTTVATRRL